VRSVDDRAADAGEFSDFDLESAVTKLVPGPGTILGVGSLENHFNKCRVCVRNSPSRVLHSAENIHSDLQRRLGKDEPKKGDKEEEFHFVISLTGVGGLEDWKKNSGCHSSTLCAHGECKGS